MSPTNPACPFTILGLRHDASETEVRSKYKKLAMLYHPDKNSSHSAVAEMSKINHAKDKIDAIFEARKTARDASNQSSAHTCSANLFRAWQNVFGEGFHSYPKPFTTKNTNPWSHSTQNASQANPWSYGSQNASAGHSRPRHTGIWTPGSGYNDAKQQQEQERARRAQEAERLAAERAEAERRAEMERRHATRATKNAARQCYQEQAFEEDDDNKTEEELIREHNERLDKIYAKHAAEKLAAQTTRQTAQWAKQQCQQQRSECPLDDGDRQRRESQEQKVHAYAMFAEESTKNDLAHNLDSFNSPTATANVHNANPAFGTNSIKKDTVLPTKDKKTGSTTKAPDSSLPEEQRPVQEHQMPQRRETCKGVKTNHEDHPRGKSTRHSKKQANKINKRKKSVPSQQEEQYCTQEQQTPKPEPNNLEGIKVRHEDRSQVKPHHHSQKKVDKINKRKAQTSPKQERSRHKQQKLRQVQENQGEIKVHNEGHPQDELQGHSNNTDSRVKTHKAKASARAGALREVQRRLNRQQNTDTKDKDAQKPDRNGPPNHHPGKENLDPLAPPFTMPVNHPPINIQKWKETHQTKKRALSKQRDADGKTPEMSSKRMAPESEARNTAHQRMKRILETQNVLNDPHQATEQIPSQPITDTGEQRSFTSNTNPPPGFHAQCWQYGHYGAAPSYTAYGGFQQPSYPPYPMTNTYHYYVDPQTSHHHFATPSHPGQPCGSYQSGFYYDTAYQYGYNSTYNPACPATFPPTW